MGSSAMLDWMRRQLCALNVQLEVRATDYNRFQDKMRNGSAQMYIWGWVADYPDAENLLFLLYGPNAKAANGGENASTYKTRSKERRVGKECGSTGTSRVTPEYYKKTKQ